MFTKVLDIEHLFCYIIEKNKCLKKGVIQMSKNYRIKSRFRFTVFVVLTIVLMTTAANFALGLNTAASSTVQEYMDVEIKSGDTLWNIAETYMPDNMDTREAVYQICSLNDLSADELYAGMTIQVPVYR